ncbi:hypothetical protein KY284_005496 [Solanum tuberosum]|nr:hypothetical protein KY284_005496 [Solanum tuberosum]
MITISNKFKENGEGNCNGVSPVEYEVRGRERKRRQEKRKGWKVVVATSAAMAEMVLVLEEVMAKEEGRREI